MFVVISMIISVGILGFMFWLAKQRESSLKHKYALLSDLRQVLHTCRQHRHTTHLALMSGEIRRAETLPLSELLMKKSQHLIATARTDNKPMYRVLQMKLRGLIKNWPEYSVARNQMVHGKAIRHCMFLMDEIILSWLVEVNREDLTTEYHMNWQQIVDAMDALTQLRICIQDMDHEEGKIRIQHSADMVCRKINQLAVISPLSIAAPDCVRSLQQLESISQGEEHQMDAEAMYRLTADISLNISHVYDQMLGELTESLYVPLPKSLPA
ncbi:hypothetical protein [Vibrio quintilis]|uniref:Nitrate and nitrite sensing n=1 Tax=Vibrio quintilis TaxID=1117707 RepID=A0A1M7YXV9_9VIBR|nr:hypothetical protein [Vibrio quintilis]SHO57480.1 hypothetical protein VQ7734_03250 [Vibrio quintilis]